MKQTTKEKQIEFLEQCEGKYDTLDDLTADFNEFCGTNVSKDFISRKLYYHNLSSGIQKAKNYTKESISFLRKIAPGRSYAEIRQVFNNKYNCNRSFSSIRSIIADNNICNGLDTTFQPGENPPNTLDINSTVIDSEGYHRVKTDNKNTWQFKHRAVWESAHGKIPPGHVVIFADRNKDNLNIDNLIMISRGELVVLNKAGLISEDRDLTKAGVSYGRLTSAILKKTRRAHDKPTLLISQDKR